MQVGTREFTGPEALQQYYNGAGGGCRALDRNVCIRPFVTLVMGISLMYPVQGQLHAQDEDDLEAMGWSLVRDREGVAVYNRQFADSKVRGVMARAEVDVESARIFAVITDFDNWSDFMPYVYESEIIDRSDQIEWVYLRFRGPFIKDRSFVSKVTIEKNIGGEERYIMKWRLAEERTRELNISGVIVPRSNTGYWELQPIGDGTRTHVTYSVHADPAGKVPKWMINFANKRIVPSVFKAVRRQAQLDQYEISNTVDSD
jgi:ribosome-associated toxin RatA of RatAB toxin-antitoxin module